MTKRVDAQDKTKSFLEGNLLFEFGDDIHAQTNLFERGIMDSFSFIQLVTFLEKEFKIKISDEELMSYQLSSLNEILALLDRKGCYDESPSHL